MRVSLTILIALLIIGGVIDFYIWHCSRRCRNRIWPILQYISAIALTVLLVVGIALPAKGGSENHLQAKMWMLFGYFSFIVPKIVGVLISLIALIPVLFQHPRLRWLNKVAVFVALATCGVLWWGALVNRLNLQVHNVEVVIPDLPGQFNGMRIVQFSDLHTGTFGCDTTFVHSLVEKINSLNGDIVVFTGDIVNRQSSEVLPFITPLSRLKAPKGVYAILGNHDYGDYRSWKTPAEKDHNMAMLNDAFNAMNIDLIRNSHRLITSGSDTLVIIGVENIGEPPFSVYGSLPASYPTISDSHTKILLTHNPRHWVDSIANDKNINIALTLSGHTHAMQIEVAGMSPAALKYATWGGLYSDKSYATGHPKANEKGATKWLYVNIGSGAVGMPARIGATPEITVITLRKGD